MLSPLSKRLINKKSREECLNSQEGKNEVKGLQTVNHMSEKCEFTPQFPHEVAQSAVSWQFDITLFSVFVKSSALKKPDLRTIFLVVSCIFWVSLSPREPAARGHFEHFVWGSPEVLSW